MQIPTKSLNNGFTLPVYGFGTWKFGGTKVVDPANDDAADIAGLKYAISQGVTHIDSAENYAEGHAEEIVGQAIKDTPRNKLFLVSKVHREHCGHDNLLAALKNSLKRLGTDYLDLYLIHSPSLETPIEETMEALNEAADQGLIKYIGVSNFTVERLSEAQKYSQRKIVCDQLHLNLQYREPERKGLLKYCQENDVMLVAWRPVESAHLVSAGIPILDEMCAKYNKTPSQIAINWLVSQKNVVTISKTRTPAHLDENLGALDWKMDESDIERLRNEFPDQKEVSNVVPLI